MTNTVSVHLVIDKYFTQIKGLWLHLHCTVYLWVPKRWCHSAWWGSLEGKGQSGNTVLPSKAKTFKSMSSFIGRI